MSKPKLLDRDAFWDASNAQNKIHFRPTRRGSAKITWPLAPKKALIKLTGRTPYSRAFVAYVHFFNARKAHLKLPLWSSDMIRKEFLTEPWPKEFFLDSAEEYLKYPRKGFNRANQTKRISKVLRELELE